MKHPADEYLEDFAADRFYGERSWNPLEQEPLASSNPWHRGLFSLGLPWDIPWLEDRPDAHGGTGSSRPVPGFWPLALGMLVGGLVAHRLGGPLLLFVGVLLGLRLGLAVSTGRRTRGG